MAQFIQRRIALTHAEDRVGVVILRAAFGRIPAAGVAEKHCAVGIFHRPEIPRTEITAVDMRLSRAAVVVEAENVVAVAFSPLRNETERAAHGRDGNESVVDQGMVPMDPRTGGILSPGQHLPAVIVGVKHCRLNGLLEVVEAFGSLRRHAYLHQCRKKHAGEDGNDCNYDQ
ncbi:hypothetical protein SDC9_196099 [bioreactor metagenome]|uniref:Uncharacterized protein n=1 Tax=bioreactor metagenome TaxID=1076179 RepID=A0A645ICD5_9ZZZZ